MQLIGTEVRKLRAFRGWSQSRLAAALGTDAGTVSRWERGIVLPRPGAIRRLRALGLRHEPSSEAGFVGDPAARLRLLDRAVADQLALKRRARRSS